MGEVDGRAFPGAYEPGCWTVGVVTRKLHSDLIVNNDVYVHRAVYCGAHDLRTWLKELDEGSRVELQVEAHVKGRNKWRATRVRGVGEQVDDLEAALRRERERAEQQQQQQQQPQPQPQPQPQQQQQANHEGPPAPQPSGVPPTIGHQANKDDGRHRRRARTREDDEHRRQPRPTQQPTSPQLNNNSNGNSNHHHNNMSGFVLRAQDSVPRPSRSQSPLRALPPQPAPGLLPTPNIAPSPLPLPLQPSRPRSLSPGGRVSRVANPPGAPSKHNTAPFDAESSVRRPPRSRSASPIPPRLQQPRSRSPSVQAILMRPVSPGRHGSVPALFMHGGSLEDGDARVRSRPEWAVQGDRLSKRVQAILNKLTPETFERLVSDVEGLHFKDAAALQMVAKLIFNKAVLEPKYAWMYSDLCVSLCTSLPVLEDDQGRRVEFRRVLLTQCQAEFTALLEGGDQSDAQRRLHLGNVKFVGELYLKRLLPVSVILHCTRSLLQPIVADPANNILLLESLCKLLTSVGQSLDVSHSTEVTGLLTALQRAVTDELGSRVVFMVTDLVELRANGWRARREEEKATKLDDVAHRHGRQRAPIAKVASATVLTQRKSIAAIGKSLSLNDDHSSLPPLPPSPSSPASPSSPVVTPPNPSLPRLTHDVLEVRLEHFRNILRSFFSSNNTEVAIAAVKASPPFHQWQSQLLCAWYLVGFDFPERQQHCLCELLLELFRAEVFGRAQCRDGVVLLCSMLPEVHADVPHVFEYASSAFTHGLFHGYLELDGLLQALLPLRTTGHALLVALRTLQHLTTFLTNNAVVDLYTRARFSLMDLTTRKTVDDVKAALRDHGLEFLAPLL